ncbi:hypothetical protein Rrhod_3977 [Rhodococcus rhodnii LMG 5362]|uniref:Uncharacterized protein n=1 Tax=Rhodococcus rhodnii LMG 5362 TaxID=1273125 RepID=R7WHP8_9NOCA|nr:hypothetical protein Rrhod_3977 [Rhodococcus rhodnii LMG 5362]
MRWWANATKGVLVSENTSPDREDAPEPDTE